MAPHTPDVGVPLLLDPLQVELPRYLQRLRPPQSFTDASFLALKSSIAHFAGNVQPIKVCSMEGQTELVFGFRRLAACRELGLPVNAVVQDLSGTRQLQELDASNDAHQVSLYERGCLYEAALQAGYAPSRRRLAELLGRALVDVGNAIAAATLPQPALDALRDPRMLTVSQAKRIAAAFAADPDGASTKVAAIGRGIARPAELVASLRSAT